MITIDKNVAEAILRQESANADGCENDPNWLSKVEKLSDLCANGAPKTHLAFLGTALLAKAVNRKVDLYAVKPTLAQGNNNAFSARSLCHSVLVPLALELGISIGVTGREPLNNQPYFRMRSLGDETPVHKGGREAFDYMLELVKELSALPDETSARQALRAFITVRRRYQLQYIKESDGVTVSPECLVEVIPEFVRVNSEGGRRAQAVVAGLIDVFAGNRRVESGRINDPSRKYPGDVCVRMAEDPEAWEKAIEVRDKPVSASDVYVFVRTCAQMGVSEAAIVMVADKQPTLDTRALEAWSLRLGISLTLFYGWQIVDQVLFWSGLPKAQAASEAAERIEERLIGVEVSPKTVALWREMVRKMGNGAGVSVRNAA